METNKRELDDLIKRIEKKTGEKNTDIEIILLSLAKSILGGDTEIFVLHNGSGGTKEIKASEINFELSLASNSIALKLGGSWQLRSIEKITENSENGEAIVIQQWIP